MKKLSYILASTMYLLAILYYGIQLKGLFRVGEATSNTQIIENLKLLLSNKVFLVTFPIFLLLTVILISAIVSLIIQKTVSASAPTALITTEERIKLIKVYYYYTGCFISIILIFIFLFRMQGCLMNIAPNPPSTQNNSTAK